MLWQIELNAEASTGAPTRKWSITTTSVPTDQVWEQAMTVLRMALVRVAAKDWQEEPITVRLLLLVDSAPPEDLWHG